MLRSLVLGLLLVAGNSFAITTADCPESLTVTATELSITSTVEKVLEAEGEPMAEEHEEAIVKAFENLEKKEKLEAKFSRDSAKNGRCLYRSDDKDSMEKIELYTSRKKDKLYFQKDVGPRGILVRVYANIASLSPKKVELTDDEAGIALAIPRYPYKSYSAGGSLEFVGKAADVSVKAK